MVNNIKIEKCNNCTWELPFKEWNEHNGICPNCGHYRSVSAYSRINSLADGGIFKEWKIRKEPIKDIAGDGYIQKLASVKEKSYLNEAIVIGEISIARNPVAIGVMDVGFMMEGYLDVFPKRFYSSGAAAPCSVREDLSKKVNNKEEFFELLKSFGGIDFTLLSDEDFVEAFLPTIKVDMILVSQYTDKCIRRIKCPIVLMEGTEDKCDISQWIMYAENSLKTVYFKGNHFFIEENVSEVIKILERGIEDEI